MTKTDRCVVRNEAYSRGKVGNMERHNERKNEHYGNGDVQLERSALNIHFKECEGGYLQTFDKLIEDGTISTRGLKKDAKIIDEMIFDVNSEYFERNGGYEYAKSFFEEAYRMAINEAGGEQYVLSAVMHADERNKALSEQLGRDVYHYHLHVVYVPVVDTEIKWTKRCKDPALVGTVKDVIKQVSNSKKWKSVKMKCEDGTERLVYSYSLLQDRYFKHMRESGYIDFERGERGSTAEHLEVLDFKIKQDKQTAAALDVEIKGKEAAATDLDIKVGKGMKRLSSLQEKITATKKEASTVSKIEDMGKKHTIRGDVAVSPADWKLVSNLAKDGLQSRGVIAKLKERINGLLREITGLKKLLQKYEGQSITDTMRYYQAQQRAPHRMANVIAEIMRQPPEKQKTVGRQTEHAQKRSTDIEV
ncbi:MAG: plasmid recombination protein [Sporomusa sp.]